MSGVLGRRWQAVHGFAVILRAAADHPCERPADQDGDDARAEGGRPPAEALYRPGDQKYENAAERTAELQRGERARTALLEPLDDRHTHEEVAEHARAERNDHERRVEAGQRIDLAEKHETDAERDDAGADQCPASRSGRPSSRAPGRAARPPSISARLRRTGPSCSSRAPRRGPRSRHRKPGSAAGSAETAGRRRQPRYASRRKSSWDARQDNAGTTASHHLSHTTARVFRIRRSAAQLPFLC